MSMGITAIVVYLQHTQAAGLNINGKGGQHALQELSIGKPMTLLRLPRTRDIGIVAFLDGVSAGTALPLARGQVGVQFGVAQLAKCTRLRSCQAICRSSGRRHRTRRSTVHARGRPVRAGCGGRRLRRRA